MDMDKEHGPGNARQGVIDWLLHSDPSIRWQVMRDLAGEHEASVQPERSRVAREGWGRTLLDRQRPDGCWGDGSHAPLWQSTLGTLVLLRDMGLDPGCEEAAGAVARVAECVTWGPEFGESPFFEGEVEPCINGRVLLLGAYFGRPSRRLADRLLSEQLADGGWNCEAERGSVRSSFHTTICVLEGMLEHARAEGWSPAVRDAVDRGTRYLLERRLFRRKSTGEAIRDQKWGHDWADFSYPCAWHYDVMRGLEFLRAAGVRPDDRTAEAIEMVRRSRRPDGRWPLHRPYFDPVAFPMDGAPDKPSRWNTLRASRVLDWAGDPSS